MKRTIDLTEVNNVYFIGIAGIGMSALARYFNARGVQVAGYDRDRSDLAVRLEDKGMEISYDLSAEIPRAVDLVIYTPAVPDTHPVRQLASGLDVPVMKRSEVLGLISRNHQCIAVAGTHGKTTTSALITHVLQSCRVDCSAFLGGVVDNFGSNYVHGTSDWMVVEADEYDRSFLWLSPTVAVVTSIDPDHLDIYGTAETMHAAFADFIRLTAPGGVLVMHESLEPWLEDRPQLKADLETRHIRTSRYGVAPGSDFRLLDYRPAIDSGSTLQVGHLKMMVQGALEMIGQHNALNATAAIAVCSMIAGSDSISRAMDSLRSFGGIKRRFQILYRDAELVVIDDYAHHPNEVRAAIQAARTHYAGRHITGIFQPHLYTRTMDFHEEFAAALSDLDVCIMVELYPAREQPIDGVSSELILRSVQAAEAILTTKKKLIDLLKSRHIEVLLLMGAGDLNRLAGEIVDEIRKTAR